MNRLRAWLVRPFLAVLLMLPLPAAAQEVTLLADSITVAAGGSRLVASGNIQIFYQGGVLEAERIEYDRNTGEITAYGPIVIKYPDGSLINAEYAQLPQDLRSGVARGASLLLEQKLQIAAAEVRREKDRYTILDRAVASACKICSDSDVPAWEIRAQTVTHDRVVERLYFHNASLRLFGIPVLYSPYLSIPDPAASRASGFLLPKFSVSSAYGIGFKLPYYWAISENQDATLAPLFTTGDQTYIEGEYRYRFYGGGIDLTGALAAETGATGMPRGYLNAQGSMALPWDFRLNLDATLISDTDFLPEYDFFDEEILTSSLTATRLERDLLLSADISNFQRLTGTADPEAPDWILPELRLLKYWQPDFLPGQVTFTGGVLGADAADFDVIRASAGADWNVAGTLDNGMMLEAGTGFTANQYAVFPEVGADSTQGLFNTTTAVSWSWPLYREIAAGWQTLTPFAHLSYSDTTGEASVLLDRVEIPLDITSLPATSRFSGVDQFDDGLRFSFGAYTDTQFDNGLQVQASAGAAMYPNFFGSGQFAGYDELEMTMAASLDFRENFGFDTQALLDQDLNLDRLELSVYANWPALRVTTDFAYFGDSGAANQIEGSVGFSYDFRDNWTIGATFERDFVNNLNLSASGELKYANDCIEIGLSLSRKFTTSNNVPGNTSVGLILELAQFGQASENKGLSDMCMDKG